MVCNSAAFLPANRHLKDLGVFVGKKNKTYKMQCNGNYRRRLTDYRCWCVCVRARACVCVEECVDEIKTNLSTDNRGITRCCRPQ